MPPVEVHVIHLNRSKKVEKKRSDKQDRHTIDEVLDQRTRHFIFDLTESCQLTSLETLINSGKEANVYLSHCPKLQNLTVAVKIYSTSKMSFKNREIYIDGDRRFAGLQTPNSRRLIKLWAEKEFRNGRRIFDSGLIYSPQPILVHENVLVQELVGFGSQSAPRLVDVARYLSESRLIKIYYSILRMMRDLYVKCRLVHGDLSEYNLLFVDKRVYLIDVGEATDTDSPIALTLLRIDIRNINSFFARMNIPTVDMPSCLAFIMSSGIPAEIEAEVQISSRNNADFATLGKASELEEEIVSNGSEQIRDCCGPLSVDKWTVEWIKALHAKAKLVDYARIKEDDEFVRMRICGEMKETGQYTESNCMLTNLGVEVAETPVVEEEYSEPDEVEDELEVSQSIVLINGIEVDLSALDRRDFDKEEWKAIEEYIREDKHGKLLDKKPKNVKEREKIKAMRKRRGA